MKNITRRSFIGGTSAVAVGISLSKGSPAFAAEEKKLNFYNWDTYIGPNTLKDFQKSTGITVKMDLFTGNDELFNKIKNNNPGYDVIMPTNNFVQKMAELKLLIPLDHKKIPNIKNVFPEFMNLSYDPGRKFSLPYMWGTYGLGYRKSKMKGPIDSWKVVFDSNQYAGRISLYQEASMLIPLVLKYLGYSVNDTDPKHLKQAEDLLIKQKKYVKVFAREDGQDLLLSKEVDIVMEFNGDIMQVMKEDSDLNYVVPKEGSFLWFDNLAIPVGAKHPDNAHAFINFLFDPQIGKDIAEQVQYATGNQAAFKLMPKSYQQNPVIYPPKAVLDKCELINYVGVKVEQERDAILTRVKAA